MADRFYGVVIRTRNLDAMRRFFSETLGLGQPAVDSSFWLEYQLDAAGMVLAIEKDETASAGGQEEGNAAWYLKVDNLPEFESRMEKKGFGPEGEVQTPGMSRTLIFRDPDGNRFLVSTG